MAELSIKDAVRNVCNKMEPGEKLLGYEFYNRVLRELSNSGSLKHPLSDTVLRRFREVREECGMESHISVSEYRKKATVTLTEEERQLGQRAMF